MNSHARTTTPARAAMLALLGALAWVAIGTAQAAGTPESKPKGSGGAAETAAAAVDLNTATVEELMSIKGIGASLAQRIVEFREKNGPYKSVDDLLKVQGIGEKSLEKLREHLSIGKGRGR